MARYVFLVVYRNAFTNIVKVDATKLPCLAQWKREFTMETILIELRRYMALPQNKKLPQPPEGSTF